MFSQTTTCPLLKTSLNNYSCISEANKTPHLLIKKSLVKETQIMMNLNLKHKKDISIFHICIYFLILYFNLDFHEVYNNPHTQVDMQRDFEQFLFIGNASPMRGCNGINCNKIVKWWVINPPHNQRRILSLPQIANPKKWHLGSPPTVFLLWKHHWKASERV